VRFCDWVPRRYCRHPPRAAYSPPVLTANQSKLFLLMVQTLLFQCHRDDIPILGKPVPPSVLLPFSGEMAASTHGGNCHLYLMTSVLFCELNSFFQECSFPFLPSRSGHHVRTQNAPLQLRFPPLQSSLSEIIFATSFHLKESKMEEDVGVEGSSNAKVRTRTVSPRWAPRPLFSNRHGWIQTSPSDFSPFFCTQLPSLREILGILFRLDCDGSFLFPFHRVRLEKYFVSVYRLFCYLSLVPPHFAGLRNGNGVFPQRKLASIPNAGSSFLRITA